MINPAILPENRLSVLTKAASKAIDVCVMIAARAERPILDVEQDLIDALHHRVRDLILPRKKNTSVQ
jgi:hypothetical protein